MSLRYWFPFNNDFTNLGIDTCQIINRDSIFVDGKFGKKGLSKHIDLISPNFAPLFNTQIFSISLWLKLISVPTVSSPNTVYVFSCGESGNHQLLHYAIRPTTAEMVFAFYADDYSFIGNGTNLLNIWSHFTFTYDGNKQIVYMNGNKLGERNTIAPLNIPNNSNFNICNDMAVINDLRIYDHCLSPAEVHNIAQGLILHYTLDKSNPNIVSGITKGIVTSSSNYDKGHWTLRSGGNGTSEIFEQANLPRGTKVYRIKNNTQGNKDYAQSHIFSLIEGESYTVSVYARGNAKLQFRIWDDTTSAKLIGFTRNINSENWLLQHWTFIATAEMTTDNIAFFIGVSGPTTSANVDLCGFKVERGLAITESLLSLIEDSEQDRIEDCSGFNNTGILQANNDILFQISQLKYYTCAYFKSNNNISIPNTIAYENLIQGTVNLWIKRYSAPEKQITYLLLANAYNWQNPNHNFLIIGSTGTNSITLDCCNQKYAFSPTLNIWYMYTITWDLNQHICQMYINGQLRKICKNDNINTTFAATHNKTRLGGDQGADYSLSDFRIYSTALSMKDVRELYKIGQRIDNQGNIYTRQFVQTDNATSTFLNNSNIQSSEFRESINIARIGSNYINGNTLIED